MQRSNAPGTGRVFDLRTGKPLNLPAYEPVDTFPCPCRTA